MLSNRMAKDCQGLYRKTFLVSDSGRGWLERGSCSLL